MKINLMDVNVKRVAKALARMNGYFGTAHIEVTEDLWVPAWVLFVALAQRLLDDALVVAS